MISASVPLPTRVLLAFGVGIGGVQFLPVLPRPVWCLVALVLALGLGIAGRRSRWAWVLLALACGVAWATWRAELRLADALAPALEGRPLTLVGVVAGLPERMPRGWRFEFLVEGVDDGTGTGVRSAAGAGVPGRISLTWQEPADGDAGDASAPPQPDERWRLNTRLRRPQGTANPGGMDFEAWLLARGIRATGSVRAKPAPLRLDERAGRGDQWVHRLRAELRERMLAALPEARWRGVLVALTVGDQRAIDDDTWRIFRRTGVAHLAAISGSHISLVAVCVGGALGWGWRRSRRLSLRWPAQQAGVVAGLLAALAYAAVAGMGIPVQRSVVMLAVGALAMLTRRAVPASRVMALAWAAVLLFDPWAVLSAGFWLSFAAVGVILLLVHAPTGGGAWRLAARMQLALSVALLPLLLWLFQQFPLVSPLANLIAIPVVNLLATPLGLLFLLLPWPPLLVPAEWALDLMMTALTRLSDLPWAVWQAPAPPLGLVLVSAAGLGWALLPKGTPARWVGGLAVLPLLLWQPPRPVPGAFELTTIDVGQGLAVHVRTAGHDLLFDTGPAWSSADAGARIVLPYLRATGTSRLDMLVLSHDDSDHRGGAASVIDGLPVERVRAGPSVQPPIDAAGAQPLVPCALASGADGDAGSWTWDDVEFRFLHPVGGTLLAGDNDQSCVLRIAGPGGVVLLTGDLEAAGEAQLVAREGERLASTLVVAGHHGSRTSSSPAFVAATSPRLVIYTAGYRNRYGHPHREVLRRWAATGAQAWRTDRDGAVSVLFSARPDELPMVSAWRQSQPRYWHAAVPDGPAE